MIVDTIKVGIIKGGVCINSVEIDGIETAREFLAAGAWDADDVREQPPGFGIGDSYINGEWIKALRDVEPFAPVDVDEVREFTLGLMGDDSGETLSQSRQEGLGMRGVVIAAGEFLANMGR